MADTHAPDARDAKLSAPGDAGPAADAAPHYCAVVVGTGFAGAVTACRLVEAGFPVCVFERGRRYGAEDFPRFPRDELFGDRKGFTAPPDFSRWVWSKGQGLYDVRDLGGAVSVQAAGYGGGSLIYANVHMRPPYDVFDRRWPEPYRDLALGPYFDLAAYMLGATLVPARLAKTLQLQRAAAGHEPSSWFRTPLAITFEGDDTTSRPRDQQPCDMRGRCWRGCDRQAKNTLDLNYLARAEDDGNGCEIRTMAEVKRIEHDGEKFIVYYDDLLRREQLENMMARKGDDLPRVTADYVFLCAGAINTTQLLFNSLSKLKPSDAAAWDGAVRALGSHYFPNSDSLAVVFDCDQPHEADYGPTITSAILYDQPANDEFSCSVDFGEGQTPEPLPSDDPKRTMPPPAAGMTVTSSSDGIAVVAHDPILDWGEWKSGTAAGAIPLIIKEGKFHRDDELTFSNGATARAVAEPVRHRHWFVVEDGGYPPDIEPLIGVFRSPLWLRRNRFIEGHSRPPGAGAELRATVESTPLRRPAAGRLRVETIGDAIGATSGNTFAAEGFSARALNAGPAEADFAGDRRLLLPDLFSEQLDTIFPEWFVKALGNDRRDLLQQAAAYALPMLGRLLDEMSASVAAQIDPDTRRRFSKEKVDSRQLQVLVRGLLRQVLQILAGSEAAVAAKAAEALLNPVPGTPADVIDLLAGVVLWAIGYDTTIGHSAVLLTLGVDSYRGRLTNDPSQDPPVMKATLPSRVLDTAAAVHERVLREIASTAWRGELRTNPGWTTLNQRVTVHSQGGCPMGDRGVTDASGEVHGRTGLYVMDAAAFPTSVGVNPSATIAAVAEYKIEQFIRKTTGKAGWRSRDYASARDWMAANGRREALDPLNSGRVVSRSLPAVDVDVLGLSFTEEMLGFYSPAKSRVGRIINFDEIGTFPDDVSSFLEAESDGIANRRSLHLSLSVTSPDLARLISVDRTALPPRLKVKGCAEMVAGRSGAAGAAEQKPAEGETRGFEIAGDSSLHIFVRAPERDDRKFFCYRLRYVLDERPYVMNGIKVLRDAPGFDSWHDTSTVYFEAGPEQAPGVPEVVHRGILRVPVDRFLRGQLPSMDITGTDDPARKSWALVAFYKYFARELAEVYMKRADTLKDALVKLVTQIHV